MIKTILIPTDFSDCSESAYNYALLLSEKAKADILLLHVLDIPQPSLATTNGKETTADAHFMMEMMKLTKLRMNKIRNGKLFKNVNVKEVIEIGSVPAKVLDAVQKYKADIIVMGTHGKNGLQEKFIGTNAEKIVRDAEIPVLTVKHFAKNPKLDTIVLATDFSKETEYILPTISSIGDVFNAKLILTKIITPGGFESTKETEKKIEELRKKCKLYNFSTHIYYAYDKEDGIRKVANTIGAKMIALGTHGRHGISQLFRGGSIAEEVVNHSSLPVLTLNFHKKLMQSKPSAIRRNVKKYESDLLYQVPSI